MIALLTSIILIIPIDAIAIHTSTSSNSSRTITYHHFGIEKNIDIHISFNAYDMVYSPSGKYLAICDHHITVVDTSNWETKAYYYLGDWTSDLEYSPDGEMIAISSHYDIYIFDANTLDLIKELDGVHTSPIGSLDFSPNGNYLASGANDGLCKIWNTNNWELYKNISLEKEKGLSWVEGVCYSPNGYYLVTSTDYSYYNDEIKIWNTNTWEEIKTLTGSLLMEKNISLAQAQIFIFGKQVIGI